MGSTVWVLVSLAAVLVAEPAFAGGVQRYQISSAEYQCALVEECAAGQLGPELIGLMSLPVETHTAAVGDAHRAAPTPKAFAGFAFETADAREVADAPSGTEAQQLAWGGAASWPGIHWSADTETVGGEAVQVAAVGNLSYRVFNPARGSGSTGQPGEGERGSPTVRGISDALIAAVLALIGVVAVARRSPTNT